MLWAIWSASGLAPVWDRQSTAGGVAGAAADRDLDSVLELFNAAARFTDRLPSASAARVPRQLAGQQVPGDTLRRRRAEGVQILTAHASKGLEWDLVCVAGVQEGSWPNLRLRGSLLGSELLVDVLAERDVAARRRHRARPGRGAPAVLRRGHPGPAPAGRHRRQRARTSSPRASSTSSTRSSPAVERPISRAAARHPPARPGRRTAGRRHRPGRRPPRCAPTPRPSWPGWPRPACPGAHPDDWWGLAELSDHGPVADPDRPVRVSPSRIQSLPRLRAAGAARRSRRPRRRRRSPQTLGTLVHEIAAAAPDADLATLEAMLDERWATLDFGARWYSRNERVRAREFLTRLVELAARQPGRARTGRHRGAVPGHRRRRRDSSRQRSTGSNAIGRARWSSSTSRPAAARSRDDDLPIHPQLGAYQLAVEHGAFADQGTRRRRGAAGPARRDGQDRSSSARRRSAEADDPDWIAQQSTTSPRACGVREFTATVNGYCGNCDVAALLPADARPASR